MRPRRALRVAVGPDEVAGCSAALVHGLRARGITAEVVLRGTAHPFGYPADRVLDRLARVRWSLTAPARYDVVQYQFASSWLPRHADVAWMRACGRTCVGVFYGDDCRLNEVVAARFPARARGHAPSDDRIVRRRLVRLARFCHAAVVADLELAAYVRPFFARVYLAPVPVLPARDLRGRRRDDGPPVVLHAPSDPAIKGTAAIAAAVDRVARRVPLDFRLLAGVPHQRVAEELDRADLVIDQLNSVTTGVFALEAMQRGVPVLAEVDPDALAPYQRASPVVAVTAESLEHELEALVRDRERRAALGDRGRAFVMAHHDAARVAAAMLRVYEHAPTAPGGFYEASPDGIAVVAATAA